MIAHFAITHPWCYSAILVGLMLVVSWASSPSKKGNEDA